jgi:hypothetical protein
MDAENRWATPALRNHERRKLQDAIREEVEAQGGEMRMRLNKVHLAEALWPVLLAKCERELAADTIQTPVLKVILEAQRLVGLLSLGGYSLRKP